MNKDMSSSDNGEGQIYPLTCDLMPESQDVNENKIPIAGQGGNTSSRNSALSIMNPV